MKGNKENIKHFFQKIFKGLNTSAQAESLQHSLKQAPGGIGLYMNTNKIEFKCFKPEGVTSL